MNYLKYILHHEYETHLQFCKIYHHTVEDVPQNVNRQKTNRYEWHELLRAYHKQQDRLKWYGSNKNTNNRSHTSHKFYKKEKLNHSQHHTWQNYNAIAQTKVCRTSSHKVIRSQANIYRHSCNKSCNAYLTVNISQDKRHTNRHKCIVSVNTHLVSAYSHLGYQAL